MEPADAHDAGPVEAQSPKRNQLILMMLGLLGVQNPKRNQLMLMMLGLLGRKALNGTG